MRRSSHTLSFQCLLLLMIVAWVCEAGAQESNYFYGPGSAYYGVPFDLDALDDYYTQPDGKPLVRGLRLGPFLVKAGLQVNTTYTDNADLVDKNPKSDFLFSIDPMFSFTMGDSTKLKEYISFGYTGDLGSFFKVTSNDYSSHTLWADINLLKRPTTYLRLREAFTYTGDPFGSSEFVGTGRATRRYLNQADLVIGRNIAGNYSAELGYQNGLQNYLDERDRQYSNLTNALNPTLLYEISGKTKLLVQYSFLYRTFYDQPKNSAADYYVQTAYTGFRWAPAAKLSGEVKVGYAIRTFINEFDTLGFPYKNDSKPAYAVSLAYALSQKTSIDLALSRTFAMGSRRDTGVDIINNQDAFIQNSFGLNFATKTAKNLRFTASGSYNIDQYDATALFPSRTDYFYAAALGFQHYLWRFLGWGVEYTFQKRDSKVPGNSFTENAATVSVFTTF
jgi:hypothetical protein